MAVSCLFRRKTGIKSIQYLLNRATSKQFLVLSQNQYLLVTAPGCCDQRRGAHVFRFGGEQKKVEPIRKVEDTLLQKEDVVKVEPAKLSVTDFQRLKGHDPYSEKYIPITRRSIIRHLIQEKNFLNQEEQKKFEKFALALDSAIVNRYHGLLQELKSLFDPINPDKDTITTRNWNRRERLENEFWVLQKLSNIMEKANFHELSDSTVEKALAEKNSQQGVMVSVNTDNYDVLKFWALGKEEPAPAKLPWYSQAINMALRRPPPLDPAYYKRVVVAIRLKRDDKLILKAFKEVPTNALEQLLPDGKIMMTKLDKTIISSSISVAVFGVFAKFVGYLAHIHIDWTLWLTAIFGLTGVRAWTLYKNRRNEYLLELSRMLYFRNIANNRGLLTLLIDRAEDELFKETLLAYTFLLTNRTPSVAEKSSGEQDPEELGLISQELMERRVEEWVRSKTEKRIQFDASEGVTLLREMGLMSEDYNQNLFVLPLESGLRNLPLQPPSVAQRATEYDVVEGYDRDVTFQPDEEFRNEEKKRKKYGWF